MNKAVGKGAWEIGSLPHIFFDLPREKNITARSGYNKKFKLSAIKRRELESPCPHGGVAGVIFFLRNPYFVIKYKLGLAVEGVDFVVSELAVLEASSSSCEVSN